MALFALDSALEHSDLLCMCTVVCTLNLCESMAVQWGLLSASCHRCWHNLFSRMPHPALAIYTHHWLIARQCMILSDLWTKTQFPSDIGGDTVCLQAVHVVCFCATIFRLSRLKSIQNRRLPVKISHVFHEFQTQSCLSTQAAPAIGCTTFCESTPPDRHNVSTTVKYRGHIYGPKRIFQSILVVILRVYKQYV